MFDYDQLQFKGNLLIDILTYSITTSLYSLLPLGNLRAMPNSSSRRPNRFVSPAICYEKGLLTDDKSISSTC